jgi:hypothetical protein
VRGKHGAKVPWRANLGETFTTRRESTAGISGFAHLFLFSFRVWIRRFFWAVSSTCVSVGAGTNAPAREKLDAGANAKVPRVSVDSILE